MTADSHKLWGGRFAAPTAHALDALNRSIGTDFRLWPFDIQLSQAWASALADVGVLTDEERDQIRGGLDVVADKLVNGVRPEQSDEDVHTMIDRMLHVEIGDPASRLHTGRSRNDQVATATRMWAMDAATRLDTAVRDLQRVMLDRAEQLRSALLPAYTHMQRAQPVSAAHWLLSHFWSLERDRTRIASAASCAATLPLGSGAIAGSAFPVSREQIREELGFTSISQNSMDATGDRDFVADMAYALTMLGVHLSRLSEDLILYGSSEFGFVAFGDTFSTGSSMMPQKRNPDALEIARGNAGRMLGNLTSIVATIKGLPSGYNKDLQDDKRPLFDSVDTMLLVLPAVAGTLGELRFNSQRMRAALSPSMMATDLADYLVSKGINFREAHGVVGSLVRNSETTGVELNQMPFTIFAAAHPSFEQDVFDWLSPDASVARRNVAGGTGPAAVDAQIVAARTALGNPVRRLQLIP
ncbi:MAG: argininosuccinate lyase [Gemmatimonadota bacterium]|nr:argininosuccinate lyase [Gemmatimonadota bacterium]